MEKFDDCMSSGLSLKYERNSMNECLHNYEMSAIGMKKRGEKEMSENEKEREIFFSLSFSLCVLLSKERKRRDLNQPPSFLYQCGNRNEGVSSIILST